VEVLTPGLRFADAFVGVDAQSLSRGEDGLHD